MTNKEILIAVLAEWMQPAIPALLGDRIKSIPLLSMIENWVKNTGIAPQSWSIVNDVAPILQKAAYGIIAPIALPHMQKVDDKIIPQLAHSVVDAAIEGGSLSLFGDMITFDKNDLQELKKYLDCNLPYEAHTEKYKVIKPKPESADGNNNNTAANN